jgi:Tfp pilus assembly protein PilN
MRPVNLIPPEDRRGDRAPLRAGSLAYIVVGACGAALVAVLMLVLTQNSITDHENEIARLEVARDAAEQRAQALAPYAEFASLQAQREQTIASLAESRFDWERVLRELALVIPGGVSLDSLEAASGGDAGSAGEAAAGTGDAPHLLMSGCAPSQDGVAEFVAALEDIDGVTRVGLENSTSGIAQEGTGGSSQASGDTGAPSGNCGASSAAFSLTAAFDGAVVQPEAAPAGAAPAAPAETNSTAEQVQESERAANLVPGVAP